jgi:hypothetical protein
MELLTVGRGEERKGSGPEKVYCASVVCVAYCTLHSIETVKKGRMVIA